MRYRASRTIGFVQHQFDATIAAPPDRVYPIVADLTRYPEFLDIVNRVEADLSSSESGDEANAWLVTLRAKIGPFARSKRLRMVRTVADHPNHVRFERAEVDERDHSAWTLEATVAANDNGDPGTPNGSVVTMSLHYGGRFWSGPVEAVLQAEVPEAAERLAGLAASTV